MTIVQTSYHDPASNDKPVVPSPLPQGTIYMYRASYDLITEFPAPDVSRFWSIAPDPEHYFTSAENLLARVEEVNGATSIRFISALVFSSYGGKQQTVKIYRVKTVLVNSPLYIYIWAITPAGGAA